VVTPVGGAPVDHGPLDRHRAERGEHDADRRDGVEGAMGEQPVEPDRDAEAGKRVEPEEQAEVEAADAGAPQAPDRGHHADERRDGEQQRETALEAQVLRGEPDDPPDRLLFNRGFGRSGHGLQGRSPLGWWPAHVPTPP
jgi:hypothetical protein